MDSRLDDDRGAAVLEVADERRPYSSPSPLTWPRSSSTTTTNPCSAPVDLLDLLADLDFTCRTREGAIATAERLREVLLEHAERDPGQAAMCRAFADAAAELVMTGIGAG